MSLKQNPYTKAQRNRLVSEKIKKWAIKQLKQGSSSQKIVHDIKKLFGVSVTLMTVYRWRNKYTAVTGKQILGWHKLNKTVEQKMKNKSKKEQNT
jgi:IS30 family transposase